MKVRNAAWALKTTVIFRSAIRLNALKSRKSPEPSTDPGKGRYYHGQAAQDSVSGDKSQRQLKVGEEIRHLISAILLRGSFHDPDLDGVSITVSEVSISPDFSNARVYVMPLGGGDITTVLDALGRVSHEIQHELARQLTIRRAA